MPIVALVEKRNYRGLMTLRDNVVVIPWRLYRDNIFENYLFTSFKAWQNITAEIIGTLDLRIASKSIYLEFCDKLYAKYRFTGEYGTNCFNLFHLYDLVRTTKFPPYSKQEAHRQSLEIRLSGIIRHCGEIFKCHHGIDLSKLLQTNIILELDGLATEMKQLVILTLLARIFMYYLGKGQRTNQLKTAIFVDESQLVFRRHSEVQEGPFLLGQYVALAREHGVGIIAGAQNLRDLSYSLTSNCAKKIGTAFADLRDLDEFCRMV
jgi:hypothetical protein